MSENMTQDLFDIDLTETAIEDVSTESGITGETGFRTCTTCAIC